MPVPKLNPLKFRLGEVSQNIRSDSPPDSTIAYERHTRTPMAIGSAVDINSGAPGRMAELLNDNWNPTGEAKWSSQLTTPTGLYTSPKALETYFPPRTKQSMVNRLGQPNADQVENDFTTAAKRKGMIRIGLSQDPSTRERQMETTNSRTGRRVSSDLMVHEGVHSLMNGIEDGIPDQGGVPKALGNWGYPPTEYPSYAAANSPIELNPGDRQEYLKGMIEFLNRQDKTGTLARKYQGMWGK